MGQLLPDPHLNGSIHPVLKALLHHSSNTAGRSTISTKMTMVMDTTSTAQTLVSSTMTTRTIREEVSNRTITVPDPVVREEDDRYPVAAALCNGLRLAMAVAVRILPGVVLPLVKAEATLPPREVVDLVLRSEMLAQILVNEEPLVPRAISFQLTVTQADERMAQLP